MRVTSRWWLLIGKLATLAVQEPVRAGLDVQGPRRRDGPPGQRPGQDQQSTSGTGFFPELLRAAFKRAMNQMLPGLSEAAQANAISTAAKAATARRRIPVTFTPVIHSGSSARRGLRSGAQGRRCRCQGQDQGRRRRHPQADQRRGQGRRGHPGQGQRHPRGPEAGIKSQIANLKIPDSKVKVNVTVAGVGSAKAAMASVVAAARHDASAAAAALGSLGAAGAAAGRALDQGLAGGILAGESSVVSAAASVAGAAAAAARKAAGIASPSKVWHGIGKRT